MVEVSIIVPVFNVEPYIKECLNSLTKQTMKNIEIILIDDGSTDSSGKICDEYSSRYLFIRVFHRENVGISKTREFGVKNAFGKFILFVDSDDYVESDYCTELFDAIIKMNADIAECNYSIFNSLSILNNKVLSGKCVVADKDDFINNIFRETIVNGKCAVVMWNKIYKRELIQKYVFDYGESQLEDYIFNLQYYSGVNRYVYIDKTLIHYRKTIGSLSRKVNIRTYDLLKNVQQLKEQVMKNLSIYEPEDIKSSAKWFVNYTYNFLKNLLICKNRNNATEYYALYRKVVTDHMMIHMCELTSEKTLFVKYICEKRISRLYFYMRICSIIQRMKISLTQLRSDSKSKSRIMNNG